MPTAPLTPAALLSQLNTTTAGARYGYASVLATSGEGTRRFVRRAWPMHIAVELSCRGGRSVAITIGHHALTKVFCEPGISGGIRTTITPASSLTAVAAPGTRWSLVVAAGHR